MNDEERKEAMTRFAKAFGDGAGILAMAFIGVTTAVRECTEALERFNAAAKEAQDDPDRA